MSTEQNQKKEWEEYCAREIALLAPILSKHGFVLHDTQPHIAGERYLMQAVTTTHGKKIILLGQDVSGTEVVIKATRDRAGKKELVHERTCRTILAHIDFAGEIFHTPPELAFIEEDGFVVAIQQFISQTNAFLERPLDEQFSYALRAFKGQESAHATTWKHHTLVADIFGIRNASTYLNTFTTFRHNIQNTLPEEHSIHAHLMEAERILGEHRRIIEQYSGFLTHTDFVPHNIRIKDSTMYLLDHSSLTFGNKYEGWARFINFMTLHNPSLENALVTYVAQNRTPEESTSLRMMRIYRLGEIIWYYIQTLSKSTEELHELNTARVNFWSTVLSYVLKDAPIPEDIIHTYTRTRDALRSPDEKKRQEGLH